MLAQTPSFLKEAPVPWGGLFRHPRRLQPLWGDGLIDQSLSTAWYGSTWDDISDDEMVFFQPSLAFQAASGQRQAPERLCDFLLAALGRQIVLVADVIAAALGDERDISRAAKIGDILGIIDRSGALISVFAGEAFRAGCAAGHDAHAGSLARRASIQKLAAEFEGLARLARLHADACGIAYDLASGEANGVGFEDALRASIEARFNAAYLYRRFDWAHEIFTAGAWIGILLSGRAALMPLSIAETLLDICASERSEPSAASTTLLLDDYIGIVGGPRKLARVARRVAATGRAAVVALPASLSHREAANGIAREPVANAFVQHLSSEPLLRHLAAG